MKILVIEDEILIQQSLKKLLEKMGATVSTEAKGKEALSKIKSENFNRIVCDLMLQDITGFDIIEESKSLYSPDEISKKFIIITAYSSEQVLNKAKDYGCIVLNKPFSDMKKALSIMINGNKNEK